MNAVRTAFIVRFDTLKSFSNMSSSGPGAESLPKEEAKYILTGPESGLVRGNGDKYKKIRTSSDWIEDPEYGSRLLIGEEADKTEVEENVRAAKTLLDSFPGMTIKIRQHVYESGVKNPEYEINGLVADRKGVESHDGITYGFRRAIQQGCKAVVIDFDMHLRGKNVRMNKVAQKIHNRYQDFETDTIIECYVIHNGKAICITKDNLEITQIEEELKKISRE